MMEELQDFVDTATNSPLLSGCKAFPSGAAPPALMVPILQPTYFFLDIQAIMYMAAPAIVTLA